MGQLMTCIRMGTMAVFLPLVAVAHASDEEVALDEAPKAVLEAVKTRFAGGELKAAAKEMDEGKLVYEITVEQKGQNIDVILTPAGQIQLIEKQIDVKDLPEVARKTLEEKYPGASYITVEEMIEVDEDGEKLACYEALLVTAEEKNLEVKVTAEGKIIEEESKDPH